MKTTISEKDEKVWNENVPYRNPKKTSIAQIISGLQTVCRHCEHRHGNLCFKFNDVLWEKAQSQDVPGFFLPSDKCINQFLEDIYIVQDWRSK